MSTIAKVNVGSSSHLIASSAFGTCTTAADNAAKEATIQGSHAFTLTEGVTVHIWFQNTNTIASPTLNVNGTGALPIYRYGTTAPSTSAKTSWQAGSVISFTYNKSANSSGCWTMNNWLNNDTTYTNASLGQGYATCSTGASTVAKTASITSYSLTTGGIVSILFTNGNTASGPTLNITSKGAKAIYHRGKALNSTNYPDYYNTLIKANDVVTFIYSSYYHIIAINGLPIEDSLSAVAGTSPVTVTESGGTATVALEDAYGDTKNPYGSKTKNYVLAAPKTADGTPSFRALSVDDISDLGDIANAMVFRGTVGTGGTVTDLPTTNVKVGDTYRVITAGTYGGHTCEVGDLIIATATTPTWTVAQSNITGFSTITVGSASAGTAISADDITSWNAGELPTAGDAKSVATITHWSAGSASTLPSLAYSGVTVTPFGSAGSVPSLAYSGVTVTPFSSGGTVPSLVYSGVTITPFGSAGSVPSLAYSGVTITPFSSGGSLPSLTIDTKTVMTAVSGTITTTAGTQPKATYANGILTITDGSTPVVSASLTLTPTTATVGSASGWSAGSMATGGTAVKVATITNWSAGSTASGGTPVKVATITNWSAGTAASGGTAVKVATITNWSAGSTASAGTAVKVATITNWSAGTASSVPSLSYSGVTLTPMASAGSLPSLVYSAKTIPNISVSTKTVVTSISIENT